MVRTVAGMLHRGGGPSRERRSSGRSGSFAMPHKANAGRRHHIPRPKRRVINWAAYDVALRRRGSLTVWFTEEAIASWRAAPRTTPGGQPHYSALAITTALMVRAVFRLALRQTEGLIGSILHLLGLLPVPDHSTIGRRARTMKLPARPCPNGGPLQLLVDSTGLKLGGPGGVVAREAWDPKAALVSGPVYRHGCGQRPDRGGDAYRSWCR